MVLYFILQIYCQLNINLLVICSYCSPVSGAGTVEQTCSPSSHVSAAVPHELLQPNGYFYLQNDEHSPARGRNQFI